MRIDGTTRLLVIGNSGSGKTTLAMAIGVAAGLNVHDLDPVRWRAPGVKRDADEAKAMVAAIAGADAWVVEGVYGWLAEIAVGRATALIWLDLPFADCRNGLARRPLQEGETEDERRALIDWASDYETRETSSSQGGHGALFRGFGGPKRRLTSREEVFCFLAASVISAKPPG